MSSQCRIRQKLRRGTTIVESSIVLSVVLLIVMSFLELSLLVVRVNSLTEACQNVSRLVSVSGDLSSGANTLGPATIQCNAEANNSVANAARRALTMVDPSKVELEVVWSDGTNSPGDLVVVHLDYQNASIIPLVDHLTDKLFHYTCHIRIAH
ncbi:TadE/TadG family type IV pilus assembly protein [Aureliella helgolandensis]|nr:TadE family protein [Aureliella helgolandensis]